MTRAQYAALSIVLAIAPLNLIAQTAAPGPSDPGSRAVLARDAGNTSEAIALYRQALQKNAAWTEGWWDLGRLLYQSGQLAEAQESFQKVVSLQPNHVPSWTMLGLCEYELKDYQNALEHLQRARSLGNFPNAQLEFAAHYTTGLLMIYYSQFEAAGIVLFPLGNKAATDADFRETMQRSGVSMEDLTAVLGQVVLRLNRFPSGVQGSEAAMVQTAGRAGLFLGQGNLSKARDVFRELVTQYPKQPNVHYATGISLEETDSEGALREFKQELEISPNHVAAMLNIAVIYHTQGNDSNAEPWAQRALQLDPQSYPAHFLLGRILLELNRPEEAISHLETAVELAPEAKETYYVLSRAYSSAGRSADATRARVEFKRLEESEKTSQPTAKVH